MKKAYYDWLQGIAFAAGAELPVDFQTSVFEEGLRVARDVLEPRGLARRKVLLVGGAGYIGTSVTQYLLSRGYQVRCFDSIVYRNEHCVTPFLGIPDYEFLRGDLVDKRAVEAALHGVTDVVLLAGLVGDPITKKYPVELDAINDKGMLALLRSLDGRGLNKVVFISTCSNYGEIPTDSIADETFDLKPLSLYATAKVAMERELLGSQGRVDYCGTVTRFATAFGLSCRMRFDLTVNEFTRELALGRELAVYDADTWRPYCHVQDFARGITRVLEAPRSCVSFEVFNVGGDSNNYTKQMIVDLVCKKLPESRYTVVQGGTDRRNYRVSFKRVRETLHFEPAFSVEHGVAELIAAMKQGMFADYDSNRTFYGNYEIKYSIKNLA